MTNTAKNLKNSIKYSSKSIVSKTFIDKNSGTITLFAFDKGQGLSEHTAPYDAFVQVIEGEAEITIGGRAAIVREGEIIILPENIPHAIKAVKKFKMLLIMIKTK